MEEQLFLKQLDVHIVSSRRFSVIIRQLSITADCNL